MAGTKDYTPQQWANYWKKKYTTLIEKYPFCIVCEHTSNDAGYFREKYFRAKTKDVKEKYHQDKTGSSYDTYEATYIVAFFISEKDMLEAYDKIFEPQIID